MSDIDILKQFKSNLNEMSLKQIEATKKRLENSFKELQAKELGILAGIMECNDAIEKLNNNKKKKLNSLDHVRGQNETSKQIK